MMTTLVINEVLMYFFDRLEHDVCDAIKMTVDKFYGNEAISAAKTLLWEKYSGVLPPVDDRLSRSQQSRKEKEVNDIYNAVKVIDKKYSNKDLPITFVVGNLSNVPAVRHVEMDSLMEIRLKMLETQMAETITTNMFSKLEADVNVLKKNVTKVAEPSIQSVTPVSHAELPKSAAEKMTVPVTYASAIQSFDPQLDTPDDVDRKPFRKVLERKRRQRKRQSVVYGTSTKTGLKAGPRRHELFIFRVDEGISTDDIKSFLSEEGKPLRDIECKSKPESWTRCYRIVVECDNVEEIMDPGFWPNGIGCRRWQRWYGERSTETRL